MAIQFNEKTKQFHLTNGNISYVFEIIRNGHLGQLYFGQALPLEGNYSYLQDKVHYRSMLAQVYEMNIDFLWSR